VRAWGRILNGYSPSLSIEITKECPLRCPGCYAYEPQHLGGLVTLRGLSDFKGDDLVSGVLELVDRHKPLHLSLVGGDPLVRYRELERLVPQLVDRGIHVQIVTSAFRPIPEAWATLPRLTVAVSIDGLQPDHDARRAPATYDRILKNIAGQNITIHCTITGQMARRAGSLAEFLAFWTPRPEIRRVWFSVFTPQMGDDLPEILTPAERASVVGELLELRRRYRKLEMPEVLLRQFLKPPHSPRDCAFALTTTTLSADLATRIGPCQFGGNPDCSQCGCMASMGLAAISSYRIAGLIPVGALLKASLKVGNYTAARKGDAGRFEQTSSTSARSTSETLQA
jgi:sulfatase maturation enzyme AslB (radical SAM superfamily)